MRLRLLLLVVISLSLSAGCSVMRKGTTGRSSFYVGGTAMGGNASWPPPSSPGRRSDKEAGKGAGKGAAKSPGREDKQSGHKGEYGDVYAGSLASDPALASFQELETEHVKFSYYDPFKGRSYLRYDLDAMRRGFHYPCNGWFSSDYGMRSGSMHTGVDLRANAESNVYAAFDGVVRMSKNYSSYGNVVVIRHYNGLETVYSHNSRNTVRTGDRVRAGDVIAKVGRTGRATAEHVHFEVRVKGQHFDPKLLIDVKNNTLASGSLYVYDRNGTIVASSKPLSAGEMPEQKHESVSAPSQVRPSSSGSAHSSSSDYHIVVRGDTLYSLARRYGTTVSRLMKLNGLDSSKIIIGQRLRLR